MDFGTTSTVGFLAVPGGGVRPLLPSAVWAAPDGTLFTGVDAERASIADPSRFEPNPKLLLSGAVSVAVCAALLLTPAIRGLRRVPLYSGR